MRPPRKAPLREALHAEPVPLPIIEQELEGGARTIAEDIDRSLQGVGPEPLPTHGGESIDPVAKIHGVGREKNAALGRQLEHAWPSKKHWTRASSGSAMSGACRCSRAPSGRWNSTVRLPWPGSVSTAASATACAHRGSGMWAPAWEVVCRQCSNCPAN